MSEALDKELNKIDRINRVQHYFESIGSTHQQAVTAAAAYADKFVYDGAVLTFQGKPVADAESEVRQHFEENNLGFLFVPKKEAGKTDVESALVERARTNLTAKGLLVRKLGSVAAAEAALAAKPADKGADDGTNKKATNAKNPWGPGASWNVTEQGRLYRVNPKLAASLAESAGSYVGATRPAKVA